MLDWGFKLQRFGNQFFRPAAALQVRHPPSTTGGRPKMTEQVVHFINKKMPGNLPKKTARALLDIEDSRYVPIIRDPQRTTSDTEAVFYFPGCGSERLFSQVGLATQAMLWHAGVQTVLPPGYLCCGYPQRGAGQFDKAEKIITDNRVLFHRVANTLNYLDIKTVVVSCGTCYDQLQGYKFEDIFSGLPHHRHPRISAREEPPHRRRYRGALHVPRTVSYADEAAGPAETVNALVSTIDNVAIDNNDVAGANQARSRLRGPTWDAGRFRKERGCEHADKLRAVGSTAKSRC